MNKIVFTIVLVMFCLLLAGDLATRFWFWKDLHLRFDATNFNNIVTPIAGIVTFLSVGFALFLSYRQNQITLSQHIIRHYDKKFNALKLELENTYVMFNPAAVYKIGDEKRTNAFNYTARLGEILLTMYRKDQQYREDLKAYRSGTRFDIGYYENRTYYEAVLNLYPYLTGQALDELNYQKIKSLLVEVESSKLIEIDKAHLIYSIKSEFVSQYVALIDRIERYPLAFPSLPDLFSPSDDAHPIQMISLSSSGFRKYYDDFKIEKSSNTIIS